MAPTTNRTNRDRGNLRRRAIEAAEPEVDSSVAASIPDSDRRLRISGSTAAPRCRRDRLDTPSESATGGSQGSERAVASQHLERFEKWQAHQSTGDRQTHRRLCLAGLQPVSLGDGIE